MVSFIGGVVALVVGIAFLIIWRWPFLEVIMGTVPALFILGGALAAYLGYEEIKDKSSSEGADDDTVSLKNEVESLKEELRELKEKKEAKEEE
jgi:hypothetical protein